MLSRIKRTYLKPDRGGAHDENRPVLAIEGRNANSLNRLAYNSDNYIESACIKSSDNNEQDQTDKRRGSNTSNPISLADKSRIKNTPNPKSMADKI